MFGKTGLLVMSIFGGGTATFRQRQVAVTVWQIPDAIDTVICAPDDG